MKKIILLILVCIGYLYPQASNTIPRRVDTLETDVDSLYRKTDSLQVDQNKDWDSTQVKFYVLNNPTGLPIDGLSIVILEGSPYISVDSTWVQGIINILLSTYKDSAYINTHLHRDTILTDEVSDLGLLRMNNPDENTRYWSPLYLQEGNNSFSGSATADTITDAGITTNDIFILTIKDTTPISDDMLSYAVESGRAIIYRVAGTTSNLQYSYVRIYQ